MENRPRVLSKTELIERVWPGVFVSDASLAKVVSRIRRAIGQMDDARIIRTVHGCGYAFAAELDDQQSPAESAAVGPATCWLICGTREFPLANGEHIVGRDSNASIRLDSPKVSRQHARLVVSGVRATAAGSRQQERLVRSRGPRDRPEDASSRGTISGIGPFALVFRVGDYAVSTESEWR